jgi:hypothetical protein
MNLNTIILQQNTLYEIWILSVSIMDRVLHVHAY